MTTTIIDSSAVDDALTFLLENLPPQMHLLIATRDDPQLPLARLRARGQLTELRAIDLRFTSAEAAQFLNQVMGLTLSASEIATLEDRTEGWIAGLQLAAVSLQGPNISADLIESFSGSHRFVLDYLIEEVLDQQSESVQTFLLNTAVLDRITGSLCDALTGQENGQATLEMIERNNLFIIPLDEERRWYRYHHLFADLLRRRLHQTQRNRVSILHQRAAEWYKQNGFPDQAIEHTLSAENFDRAAQLIAKNIDAFWAQGEHRKVQRWLDKLPETTLFSIPYISIIQARYQCSTGRLDAAEHTLQMVEQALGSNVDHPLDSESLKQISYSHSDKDKLIGRIFATRALICSYQGDVPGIIQQGRQALAILPKEDLSWRSVTAVTLGNAHGFKGDMTAAYESRFEALKACEATGNIYYVMVANLELAITLREQGRLRRTIELCRQQWQIAADYGLLQTRIVGWLLAVWGETLAEQNNLDEALKWAIKGFRLTKRSGDLQMLGWSFMCLIRILITRGDLAEAEDTIQKMEHFARESQIPPWIANQMAAWQARLWLAQDNLGAASKWMRERGLYAGGELTPLPEIDFFSLFEYMILARILIVQGQLDETSKLLRHLLMAAEKGGRTSSVIEVLILQALTHQAEGATDEAAGVLEKALNLAEPEGFIRIFVDEGPPMASLLRKALHQGIAPKYVSRLLPAFLGDKPAQAEKTREQSDQSAYYEPLSDREVEVLQCIANGLTNREIADRLYLSLNTVKVHARNIYSKLDVSSRTQATARARVLGILPNY